MRVRMIQHITGTRDGIEWPLAGGEIELPDHEAADLIGAGLAAPLEGATNEAVPEPGPEAADGPDQTSAEDSDGEAADEPGETVEPVKPKARTRKRT
jgi:hypothetical protein